MSYVPRLEEIYPPVVHCGTPERTPFRPCQAGRLDIYAVIQGLTESGVQ